MDRKLLAFLNIFALFILMGCERDELLSNYAKNSEQKISLKKVSFKELKNKPKIFDKINEFNLKRKGKINYNQRTYVDEFGVFVDTTNILYIEKDGKHTLTFRIIEQESIDKIENLVLKSNDDGEYQTYLVKYLLTHEELTLLSNGEKITDKIPNSITFFENMSLLNFSNSGNNCIEIDTYEVNYCTNEDGKVVRNTGSLQDRCAGGYHTVIYTVVFIDAGCLSSGGNSGYDPINNGGSSPIDYDGWGNPTGGPGGSPSGNNNPNQNTPSDNENSQPTNGIDDGNGNLILTTPILLLDQSETHIDELKKITDQNENNSNLIRNKINEYVGMLFSAQTEIGIEFRKNSINTFSTVSPINSGFDFVQFSDAAINTYVRIHLHHNFINSLGQAIDPIPSDGDIFGFAKAFAEMGNSSGRNNFTSIIVSRNGLYAMKVSDINKLLSFHYNLSNKTYVDNVREGFTRYVTNLARTNCNNCSIPEIDEYLEILFISFLKNQIDCGINIYKGTLNNDNNYNWIKL